MEITQLEAFVAVVEEKSFSRAAERLLRNLLNYATRDAAKPPAELPANFAQHLKEIGYE